MRFFMCKAFLYAGCKRLICFGRFFASEVDVSYLVSGYSIVRVDEDSGDEEFVEGFHYAVYATATEGQRPDCSASADVRTVEQRQLRASFGYAPQKSVLLSGTVRQNLAFADPTLSDDALLAAAKLACADTFLAEKGGLETEVVQGGKNFSGGQRRWLSIARAVAKKPKIALFDDSFSALDFATDARVRHNLKEQLPDVTKVIVAQRISTVRDADVIVVLDAGKAVGVGTHAELLKSCNVYPRLHRQNQSGAEGRHRRPDWRGQDDACQSLDALL